MSVLCDPWGLASSLPDSDCAQMFSTLLSVLHVDGSGVMLQICVLSSILWVLINIYFNLLFPEPCQGFWMGSAVETVTAMLTGGRGGTPSRPLLLESWYFLSDLLISYIFSHIKSCCTHKPFVNTNITTSVASWQFLVMLYCLPYFTLKSNVNVLVAVLHGLVDHYWCSSDLSSGGRFPSCLSHLWGHSYCGLSHVRCFH